MRGFGRADLAAAERQALAATPEGALMATAAAALASMAIRMLRQHTGGVSGRTVLAVVGSGNNGADVLHASARLARRGVRVTVAVPGGRKDAAAWAVASAAGVRLEPRSAGGLGQPGLAAHQTPPDLVIDGVIGLSGRAGLSPEVAAVFAAVPAGVPVLACDAPSGVDLDTGEVPSAAVRATVTVAMGGVMAGLLVPPASHHAGQIHLVDLGYPALLPSEPAVICLTPHEVARQWPVPGSGDHKYSRGVVGLCVGSPQYPGAAVLATGAAVRAGVGMVRLLAAPSVTSAVLAAWPEVVAGAGPVSAWVIGSGQAPDPAGNELIGQALKAALEANVPCVVDAGGLDLLPERVPATWVLTPHEGELARLLRARGGEVTAAQVRAKPLAHARQAAQLTGATILLKGTDTLVVPPAGPVYCNRGATAWLATAGSGDVLAGVLGALLAAQCPAPLAAAMAAFVHAAAGERASGAGPGPGGPLIATDLIESLPSVIQELLLQLL